MRRTVFVSAKRSATCGSQARTDAASGDVAVFRVAPVADDDRLDPPREDEVRRREREKDRHEPDPAELPRHAEGEGGARREDRAADALVEVLLDVERGRPAARADVDVRTGDHGGRMGERDRRMLGRGREEIEDFLEVHGAWPAATSAGGGSSIRAMHSEQ